MALAAKGNVPAAAELAAQLPDDLAGAEARLRIAGLRGQHTAMRDAAARFLSFAPDASGRLLAATALAQSGDLGRASEVCGLIAHDPNVAPRVRADAFALLLQTLADRDCWPDADREWQAFQIFSRDCLEHAGGRVSAWQVRILHHRSTWTRLMLTGEHPR